MVFLHQLIPKNNSVVLLLKTTDMYIMALKLFPVVCCFRQQGRKWIKTRKNWANFSSFDAFERNSLYNELTGLRTTRIWKWWHGVIEMSFNIIVDYYSQLFL